MTAMTGVHVVCYNLNTHDALSHVVVKQLFP